MILEPGQEIERFVVEGVLGEGGMAAVYRVRHQTLGSMYALKVLSIPSKSVRNRMLQEGRIQAAMRAANIVQVQDVLDVGGMMGLLMEYVKGPSLAAYLKEYQLSLDDALRVFGGVLAGVEVAHDKGLIHRDLKPANILLHLADDGLWPKVTDFGIAKGSESADPVDVTRPGSTMGTPAYMSPEQIQDASKVDARADIWSLGCLLYEVCCHRRVFGGDSILDILNAVVRGEFERPEVVDPNLPPRVIRAINGCLRFDPEDRFPDVRSLAAALAGVDSCGSVGEVLERHLPRSSSMTVHARSLAFKTPPPVPLRDAPIKATPAPPHRGGDTAPGASYSPPPDTWHAKAHDGNVIDTLGEGIPAVQPPQVAPTPREDSDERPRIGRRSSMHDLDGGIEVLSTEEVEMFRTEAAHTIRRSPRRSIRGYTEPPTFADMPIWVSVCVVLITGLSLGVSIRYKRIVDQLDNMGGREVASAPGDDDGGDTGLAIADGGAISPLIDGKGPKRKAKGGKRGKRAAGNLLRPNSGRPPNFDDLPDPAEEALALDGGSDVPGIGEPPGREETAEPDLDMPKKRWSKIKVEGDAKRVVLRAAGKDYYTSNRVPPGEFDVIAWFGDDPQPAGRIFVGADSVIKLRCSVIWQRCEVQ